MQPEQVFKALADRTRLRLLYLLVASKEPLCVCEMMDALELPQYQVSRHLGVLRNSGLVTSERRGTWMYYALDPTAAGNTSLFQFMKRYLEETQPTSFEKDLERLRARLALREGDSCVIGITDERNPNG